ncbi:MAG: hypothetical protein LBK02_05040, partial [Treponema sp.]|nr:hypothetical protein [Treponema sp.]
MKKLSAISILFTVLSATSFAQVKEGITIGGWGSIGLAPLVATFEQKQGNTTVDGELYSSLGWAYGGRPRLRMDINGANPDGKYGFTLRIATNDLTNFGVQNFARVWVSPIPQIRVDAGKFREDTLRGKVDDNSSNTYVLPMMDGNSIFSRFDVSAGALLTIKPVDGLFIGAKADFGANNLSNGFPNNFSTATLAKDGYRNNQFAVGYTIPDIGLVRAQFIGTNDSLASHSGDYITAAAGALTNSGLSFIPFIASVRANEAQVAFALTAIDDLIIDVGFKYPFALKDTALGAVDVTVQKPLHAAVGVSFASGDFDIKGRVDADFGGSVKAKTTLVSAEHSIPAVFNFHVLPKYNLGFASVGVEVGLIVYGPAKQTKPVETEVKGGAAFGAGLWLFKSWGNGSAQVGVSFQPN